MKTRPRCRFRILVALGLVAAASPARAQAPIPDNPHGMFRADCGVCHAPGSWSPAEIGPDFDHSKYGYTLEGAHAGVPCLLCHLTLEFSATTGTICADCHQDVHLGELGTECDRCHTTRSFVDRANEVRTHRTTRFPLTGAHATLECAECHEQSGSALRFANTSTECSFCHQTDYEAATNPNHVASAFPTDCAQCHSTLSWGNSTFDHALIGFPLTGAHTTAQCQQCHVDFQFTGTPSLCFGCHQSDYEDVDDPDHTGFSTECQTCHTTRAWEPAGFDHALTAFPLNGAHATTDCLACHGDGVYAGRDPACAACHLADYQSTTSPDHAASSISTNCQACHTTQAWEPATFDHAVTAFPLTGAHNTLDCIACHGDGVYAGRDPACAACHLADYQSTTTPDHVAAMMSTDCQSCHSTAAWQPATFDHAVTAFPLTGAHNTLDCIACHGDGVYAGRDPACAACHLADYQSTTNPNHVQSGFGQDCAACHGTIQWEGATFDHDGLYFPIYSGRHRQEWNACSDCHTNPGDFTVFSCLGCHPHSNQAETNDKHREVNGYSYDSQACYSCHPDGRN